MRLVGAAGGDRDQAERRAAASITIEQAGSGGTLTLKSAGNVYGRGRRRPATSRSRVATGVKIDAGAGMVELSGSQVKLN